MVAKDKSDHVFLDELLRRGRVNEIELQEITEDEARMIEPSVKTHERAYLFS